MKALELNILFFMWLGFFLLVNMAVVGVIVYAAKHKKQMPDCAGAVIIPAFMVVALASFTFGADFNNMPYGELAVILAGSAFLTLWEYFAPKTKRNRIIERVFVALLMLVSLMFMDVGGGFNGYDLQSVITMVLAVLGWLLLMYSFSKMKVVSEVVISEGSFIAFAVLLCGLFFTLMTKSLSPASVCLVAASMGVAVAGFKNYGKTVVWPKITESALLPVSLVLGWLLVKMSAMGMWAVALVIPMYFLCETIWLFIKKYVLKKKNPVPMIINVINGGAIVRGVIRAMFRNNLVLLMIAALSITGSHGGWLVLLAMVFAIYQMFRFKSWGEKQPTIREVTKGIFTEFKAGFKEQKHFYSSVVKHLKKDDGSFGQVLIKAGREVATLQQKQKQKAEGKVKAKIEVAKDSPAKSTLKAGDKNRVQRKNTASKMVKKTSLKKKAVIKKAKKS